MDEEKRLELVKILEPFLDQHECYEPDQFVPLIRFFDGNDDEGSIGCNLSPHPGIAKFYKILQQLRSMDGVSGVWVIAKQHDWKPGWPHSDEIIINTSLTAESVGKILAPLSADEIYEFSEPILNNDIEGSSLKQKEGEKQLGAWWD